MEYKNARTLEFKYYNDEKAKELEKVLKANNIDFVSYYDGLYILFRVAKSGKKWNDIYNIINSVKLAKYKFIQTCIHNGTEYEIIII